MDVTVAWLFYLFRVACRVSLGRASDRVAADLADEIADAAEVLGGRERPSEQLGCVAREQHALLEPRHVEHALGKLFEHAAERALLPQRRELDAIVGQQRHFCLKLRPRGYSEGTRSDALQLH